MAAQYGAIEVMPGLNVDGQITVTENVADLGGAQVAYDALGVYLAAQGEAEALASPVASPVAAAVAFESLTPQQRFFISAATVWREQIRDEALETQVRTDVHAPATLRATLPIRNMDEFHEAFEIEPDEPMYLPPDERIVIW